MIPLLLVTIPGPAADGRKLPRWVSCAIEFAFKACDQLGVALLIAAAIRRETQCLIWALIGTVPAVPYWVRFAALKLRLWRTAARVRAAIDSPHWGPFLAGPGTHAWLSSEGVCYDDGTCIGWRELTSYCIEAAGGGAHRVMFWVNPNAWRRKLPADVGHCALCLAAALAGGLGGAECARGGGMTNDVLAALFLAGMNLFMALDAALDPLASKLRWPEDEPPFVALVNAEYVSEERIIATVRGRLRRWFPPERGDVASEAPPTEA